MRNKFTVLFIFFAITFSIYSQLQWQEGGIQLNNDYPLYWYDTGSKVIDGISYYVWSDSQSDNPDLLMQGYDANGEAVWQNALVICDAPKYQGRGQITAASDGNLIIAWQDTRNMQNLYYQNGYDIYLQKVSPGGELLWDANGVYAGLAYPSDYQLISDCQGGCYLSFRTSGVHENPISFWHINSEGTSYPNWETGIYIDGNYINYKILTDGDGNLIIYRALDGFSGVTKLSPAGEVIWDDILITEWYAFNAEIFSSDLSVDILYMESNEIFMQKINEFGELVWNDPVSIYSSTGYISTFYCSETNDGYYLNFCQYGVNDILMKLDDQGNELWTETLDINYGTDGIIGMENGNVRFWKILSNSFAIWEYDSNGNQVGPEEGLWTLNSQEDYWYPVFGVTGSDNITTIGWRDINSDTENEVLCYQIINESGDIICGAEGEEISRGRNSFQACLGVYKIEDMEVVIMRSYLYDQRLVMKLYDEDGNIIGDQNGVPVSDSDANSAKPLGVYNNRLYFIMEMPDDANPESEVLYINAVDFSGEPELVWGTSGRYLGEGEFINTTINMTTIPGEENTLLFSWNVQSPYGYGRVQKMVNDQYVWQNGGEFYPWLNFETHDINAYNDYILQTISWGTGYYLNRVDEDGGMMWNDRLPLNLYPMYEMPIAIPQTNGNMLFLLGQYNENGLQLTEFRITPDGENLSNSQGDVITFLNGAEYMKIFDHGDGYVVVTGQDDGSFILRNYDYSSMETVEPVTIAAYEYYDILDVELLNDNLIIYTQGVFGEEKMGVYGIDGQPSELLPQNPYQYLDLANYSMDPISCKDGNDIYFCWIDGLASERREEGEYCWNWHMQKFSIPTTDNTAEEIVSSTRLELYPNPFNPDLNISWETDNMKNTKTEIMVYNIKGQLIKTWQTDSCKGSLTWDGKNERGAPCSTGVYFVRIKSGGKTVSHKAVLLK